MYNNIIIPHRTYPCVYRCCVRSRVDDRRDCVAFQRRRRLSARIPGSRSRIRDRPLFLRCLCVLLRSSTGGEFGWQSGPSRRGVDRTVAHFRNPADTVLMRVVVASIRALSLAGCSCTSQSPKASTQLAKLVTSLFNVHLYPVPVPWPKIVILISLPLSTGY